MRQSYQLKRSLVFILVAQVIILAVWAAPYVIAILFGETVYLRARVLDPRDPFRGDYIVLTFLDLPREATGIRGVRNSGRVFLNFVKEGEIWKPGTLSDQPPQGLYLTGKVSREYPYYIKWGIEEFFIEEGTGLKFEAAKELRVTLKLGPGGVGVLTKVEIVE